MELLKIIQNYGLTVRNTEINKEMETNIGRIIDWEGREGKRENIRKTLFDYLFIISGIWKIDDAEKFIEKIELVAYKECPRLLLGLLTIEYKKDTESVQRIKVKEGNQNFIKVTLRTKSEDIGDDFYELCHQESPLL